MENRLRLRTTEARFINESPQVENNLFAIAADDCTNKVERVSEGQIHKLKCAETLCAASKHAGGSGWAPLSSAIAVIAASEVTEGEELGPEQVGMRLQDAAGAQR